MVWSMMNDTICPFCEHENPAHADLCEDCGHPLNSDTTIWKSTNELSDIERPALRSAEFVSGVLYLYVASAQNQKPIQHNSQDVSILGRSSSKSVNGSGILIDLSDYDALSLGVSRQHARVSHDAKGYFIEDLDSANGTWLNGNRLQAHEPHLLRSGDHVQLGELLMFIYYV